MFFKNLVEVVKGSEIIVFLLNEEVENRRKELEECRKDFLRKNGNWNIIVFFDYLIN